MVQSIISYLIIGLISMITCIISFNIILDKEKRKKYNNIKTYTIFFLIGVIIHLIVQSIDLDKLYCDKKCQMRLLAGNL